MSPIKLAIVSDQDIEATIYSDGRQDGAEEYHSVVTVNGFIDRKKLYGVDSVPSLYLGLQLIEQLTSGRRYVEIDAQAEATGPWRLATVANDEPQRFNPYSSAPTSATDGYRTSAAAPARG